MHTLCVSSWRPCEGHSPNRFPVVSCYNSPFWGESGPPERAHVEQEGEKSRGDQVFAQCPIRVEDINGGRATIRHDEVPVRS